MLESALLLVCVGKRRMFFLFFQFLRERFSCCIWRSLRSTVASVTIPNKQWVNRIPIVFVFCWTDTTIYYVVVVCVQMDV